MAVVMTGCNLHGYAITPGCPGCDDIVDDFVIAAQVRERMASDTGERISLEALASEFGYRPPPPLPPDTRDQPRAFQVGAPPNKPRPPKKP